MIINQIGTIVHNRKTHRTYCETYVPNVPIVVKKSQL